MANEESTPPVVTTETTETQSTTPVVNSEEQTPSAPPSKDVKADGKDDSKKSEIVTFEGAEMPADLRAEIKRNAAAEADRKARAELEPLIKTEADKKSLEEYKKIVKSLGDVLKPGRKLKDGESFTTEEIQDAIRAYSKNESEHFKQVAEKAEADKEAEILAKKTIIEQVKDKRIDQELMDALLDEKSGARPEAVKYVIPLLKNLRVFTCDDDMQTITVADPETGSRMFNKSNEYLSVAEYVQHWLVDNPTFLKSSGKSGSGGNYEENGNSRSRFEKLMDAGHNKPFTNEVRNK
jgi:hypothetical protein